MAELRAKGCVTRAHRRMPTWVTMTGRPDLWGDDFAAFDGYVRKPVTFESLERALKEWRAVAD
jgi:hypothetical protein